MCSTELTVLHSFHETFRVFLDGIPCFQGERSDDDVNAVGDYQQGCQHHGDDAPKAGLNHGSKPRLHLVLVGLDLDVDDLVFDSADGDSPERKQAHDDEGVEEKSKNFHDIPFC